MSRYFAIVNPSAGSGKTISNWHTAQAALRVAGIEWHAEMPQSIDDNLRLTLQACHDGYRRFMAVGGDGTVHTMIRALVTYSDQTGVPLDAFRLAVIPIGSGNDFLRSHNLAKDYTLLADMIARDSFAPQDIVRVDRLSLHDQETVLHTSYMANIGGYNFDANVCQIVNEQKAQGQQGPLIYLRALLRLFKRQHLSHTRVVCDGAEVINEPVYTISVGNGRYSGGGLMQTPSALMDDGLLNVMVAPRFGLWRLPLLIGKVFAGRTEEIRFLRFFQAREICILPCGQGELVEVDGEVIGTAPVRFRILPGRLLVLHNPL